MISYHSVDEILNDPVIELVVVNTPNATHFDFALQAILAKKHVLLEKPFTVKCREARVLFQEALKQKVQILPFQNRRYDSDFLSVKKVIGSGKLGQLIEAHLRFDRYRYAIGPKLAKETPVPGSGLQYDLGPHIIDFVIHLFGKPASYVKTLGKFRPETQVDDYVHIHFIYPEGLQVFVTLNMLVADVQPAFVINGTKGSFIKRRSDHQENQLMNGMKPDHPLFGLEDPEDEGVLTIVSPDGKKVKELVRADKSSYLQVFEDVYQTIKFGKPYPVTEDQILQQLEILEKD